MPKNYRKFLNNKFIKSFSLFALRDDFPVPKYGPPQFLYGPSIYTTPTPAFSPVEWIDKYIGLVFIYRTLFVALILSFILLVVKLVKYLKK